MIEFTLAAVGLVAIAFMTVRVGHWLNDSMVERNESFQASRANAGRGPGVTPFAGPATPLHLIGPGASRTPGLGTPGGGDSTVKPTCGDNLLRDAQNKRLQILSLLSQGQTFTLKEQSEITWYNAVNWNMLVEANYLALHAIQVDTWRKDLLDRIYPRLRDIQNMEIVQGVGDHDICAFWNSNLVAGHEVCPLPDPNPPRGIHQIDERLAPLIHELDPTAAGTVGSEIFAYEQQASVIRTRLWEIATRLGQIGTRLPQIDTLLNRPDSDGPGPDRGGIYEELRQLEPAMTTCEPILAIPPIDPFNPSPEYVFCSDLRSHVQDLERQRDDLLQEQANLPVEQANLLSEQGDAGSGLVVDLNRLNDLLQPLYTLRNYLWGELYGLLALHWEVNGGWGLQAQQFNYLSQVDAIVDSWTPLWQQLHPGTELWDQDLSDLFQQTIQAWDDANANSPDTVLLDLTSELYAITDRLLEMMLERLDHTDWSELPSGTDYIGQIPQSLLDRFGIRLPLVSPDAVNPGGQREANARILPLMAHTEEIRTLILEAEELERQARRDCTSATE